MGGSRDVYFAGNENESACDLDWEEVGNYGADSEVEKFLQNNEETQGYEELQNQADMDLYKIFAKRAHFTRSRRRDPRSFKQFKKKLAGTYKGRGDFRKMKAGIKKKGSRNQFTGEKQSVGGNGMG